uniref:Uncharacterized protein n=1 Tax=Anguilla anguilla TaxID=7936 RepID=A0A0E9SA30_ANGAN
MEHRPSGWTSTQHRPSPTPLSPLKNSYCTADTPISKQRMHSKICQDYNRLLLSVFINRFINILTYMYTYRHI